MAKKNKIKYFFIILLLVSVSSFIFVINLDTAITVGINGYYRQIGMPLYVKWTQFLARHYEYIRLAGEITKGCKIDEEKVLAILKWTQENLKDVPAGMPVYDDHILNIIIRGYGLPGQFQDVFTALCSYSGVPAFFEKVYGNSRKHKYVLSFVKLHGKWRVFDAYKGVYFRTKNNEIASVEDIINDKSLVSGADNKEFYLNLKPVTEPMTLRAHKQMPLERICFEAKKALGIEKDE